MSVRTMKFTRPAEKDFSKELKDALNRGVDDYLKLYRTVSEAQANEIIAVVEAMLDGRHEPAKKKPTAARGGGSGGRGGKGRARNKLARWKPEDVEALRNLDWETLDAIWEGHKDGTIQQDADLKADQKKAIMTAYAKVPGDKRAERSETANVVGRLKHLVSAYELAEAQDWKV